MALTDNEFSVPKITPADGVKIPSIGSSSGYQLDEELREYIQEGVTGVTEEYSTLMTYAYGKRLKHEGVEYRCIVPVESPEIFDPDKWVKVDLTELDKRVLANADAINAIMKLKYRDVPYSNPAITEAYGYGLYYGILQIPSDIRTKVVMAQFVNYSDIHDLYMIPTISNNDIVVMGKSSTVSASLTVRYLYIDN